MGSFIGHAIPGAFFFLFGVWWITQVMRRHFLCRQTRQRFRSTATFPFASCPRERLRNLPLESIVKIFFCSFGIVVEIYGGINSVSHRFDSIGNAQHITMYFFFALSGVLDLLTMRGLAPEGTDYMGMVIALLVEGALFKFHLFGRDELDVLIHVLLLYVIGFSALVITLEAAFRNTAVLPMLRALLSMLQGTWFWGVGFILYNPLPGAQPWDPDDHHSLMFAVVCFSWHVAVNLVLVIAVGGVTACCYRNTVHYSKLDSLPLKSLGAGEEEEEEREEGLPLTGEFRDEEEGIRANGSRHVARGRSGDDDDLSDLEFQAPLRK